MERGVGVGGRRWVITGDERDSYFKDLADPFEPHLVSMLAVLCDRGAQVLDIGANIGCTALALSQIVDNGRVTAFEPVPRTFGYLSKNVGNVTNVKVHNFALGRQAGTLPMQGSDGNYSGAFIADEYHIGNEGHFQINVPVYALDEVFPTLGLDRVDFIKIDVEGFELDVLEGASQTLKRFKPRAVLEMNHFCLNMFRRTTIPEFRERLLRIFPCVYAVDGEKYFDLTDESEAYAIGHEHITQGRYSNLVAGFDRTDLIARLSTLNRASRTLDEAYRVTDEANERVRQTQGELTSAHAEIERLQIQLAEKTAWQNELERERTALLSSSSWRITRPLRYIKSLM